MSQVEIEIKVKISKLNYMEKKLKTAGAKLIGKTVQKDTYFSPAHKSLIGKSLYLRIRENIDEGVCRLEYHIGTEGCRKCSFTKEFEVKIDSAKTLRKIFDKLDFKQELIVNKIRATYKLKDLNIVLDKVKGLGNFMEIEMINKNRKEAEEKIFALLSRLKISTAKICFGENYFDMTLDKLKNKN